MPDTLVLCYHALSPSLPAPLSVRPRRFAQQLALLRCSGYEGVTFSDAVAAPVDGRTRRVAVTFDDAYRSVIEVGLPILARIGWPATVFAPTDFIGSEQPMSWEGITQWAAGPHERALLPMSWQHLRDLCARGWEVGSHTCSHPHLTRLPEEGLRAELSASRRTCEERLDRPCPTIAYPYGDVDARVEAATAAAGYRFAAALRRRPHAARTLQWPRVGIYVGDGVARFALKASPLVRRLRAHGRTGASGA